MSTRSRHHRSLFCVNLLLRFLTAVFSSRNFLGSPLISFLLSRAPKKHRKSLALRILGISPHYFIYQFTPRYSSKMPYRDILQAEHERITKSRQAISEKVLNRWLMPNMCVLDFGCGAGHLIYQIAHKVRRGIGVDISSGAIACAKELHGRENIEYLVSDKNFLSKIADQSVDLICSFNVIQHLREDTFDLFIKESFRILKADGKILCHIPLEEKLTPNHGTSKYALIKKMLGLEEEMFYRNPEKVKSQFRSHRFRQVDMLRIGELCDIDDNVSKHHLFIVHKQLVPSAVPVLQTTEIIYESK